MKRFKNVLAVVDDNAQLQVAATQAARLAARNHGKLKLVKVIREFGWLKRIATPRHAEVQEQLRAMKLTELDALADSLRREDLPVTTKVLVGKSSIEITREVHRDGHDIVVKQAKGLQGVNGFFGTTGLRLLRTCPCPVWIIDTTADEHPHRVMAAVDATGEVDGSQINTKILDVATSFCGEEKCRLEVVQAWSVYGETMLADYMQDIEFQQLVKQSLVDAENGLDKTLAPYGLDHDSDNVYLLHGDPGQSVALFAEERRPELIVMGTTTRPNTSGDPMGKTAETILGENPLLGLGGQARRFHLAGQARAMIRIVQVITSGF